MEFLEAKVKDELTIMATSVEVKTQDAVNTMKLMFDELEVKMRDELVRFAQDTDMKFERSRHDTCSNMEEKDKTLRVMIMRMGEEQARFVN